MTTTDVEVRAAEGDIESRQTELFSSLEEIAKLPPGSIRFLGLQLTDPDMSYQEWESLGILLGGLRRWGIWALGDWYNWGEELFGEQAAQAVESTREERMDVLTRVTSLAPDTIINYGSLARRIAIKRRRVELDPSVHEPVGALEADEQIYWLQQAVENKWGRAELRQAIRDAKAPPGEPGEPVVLPPEHDGLTIGERIEAAARLVFHQAQRASNGDVLVPAEPWAQLGAALGEE